MAAPVTLAELREQAQKHADMVNSDFIDNDEWNDLINDAAAEFYDYLVQCGHPDYTSSDMQITLIPGQRLYGLPGDFRTLTKVLLQDGSGYQTTLYPLGDGEFDVARQLERNGIVNIEYIPTPPRLELDTDALDFVSGWSTVVTRMAARDALAKEESDTSVLQNYIDRQYLRVRTTGANRDRGQPKLIGRRNNFASARDRYPWSPISNGLIRYRLRGGNIEFYQI